MKMLSILILSLVFAICVEAVGQGQNKPLTNEDVIRMVSNGLPENVVISSISANDVNFDVTPNGLLALKKANVSDNVVDAVLSAEKKNRDAGHSAASPGSPQLPKVALIVGERKLSMQATTTEIAQGKGKGGSKAGGLFKGLGKTVLMAGGMPQMGGSRGGAMPRVAYTWALPGPNSQVVLPTSMPTFEVEFGVIAGVDPDAYEPVIVKLIQTHDNWRLVETSKDKLDTHGNDTRSIKTEEQAPVKVAMLGPGHLKVSSASELAGGEYGLVLHPKKDQKELAGVPSPNVDALFHSVWDFSVPASESVAASGGGHN